MANLTVGSYLSTVYMKRSGIIPYYVNKNKTIIFLLAIDRKSGDYTDFGGGVKQVETALLGAKREFVQETDGIYGAPSLQHLASCPCLYDKSKSISIIFFPLKTGHHLTTFNTEISGIEGLSFSQIKKSKKVWARIWKLFKSIEPYQNDLTRFYYRSLI